MGGWVGGAYLLDAEEVEAVLVGDEIDSETQVAKPTRATNAVEVGLRSLGGWVEEENEAVRMSYCGWGLGGWVGGWVGRTLGKSKLMTTLTLWMSIPRVKRSREGREVGGWVGE